MYYGVGMLSRMRKTMAQGVLTSSALVGGGPSSESSEPNFPPGLPLYPSSLVYVKARLRLR